MLGPATASALAPGPKGAPQSSMFATEGLEGVVAARTAISLVKGDDGALAYRGYSAGELADKASFEEVAHLLWYGELPSRKRLAAFSAEMRAHRAPPGAILEAAGALLGAAAPIDALRSAVSLLAAGDPEVDDSSEPANLRKAVRVVAAMPALVAAHARMRKGLRPAPPEPRLGHAAHFLYLLRGAPPAALEARALEHAMILQADHGLNASTVAARVTASTLADLHAALTSALAALKGPLHGGASREVIEMLLAIGEKSRARDHIEKLLSARKRVPSFGHRIHKAADPRAGHLKRSLRALAEAGSGAKWYELAGLVEDEVRRRRGVEPNLDFYSAVLYHLLGLQPDQFAAVFACARAAGWAAHVIEQHLDNRLIRPLEEYIGPLPRPFVAIEDRP